MSVVGGIAFHAVGAAFAALCYTPQKKVVNWSWQTYWLAQAFICWFLLPILVAWITIPELLQVLQEAPKDAMWKAFALGLAYGIGGTAFGLAIKYIGFSLTYAISIGLSCVIGTLLPPLVKGELGEVLSQSGSQWIIMGMLSGILGIAFCGVAGRFKEIDLSRINGNKGTTFSVAKGLPLCILAGVLSALYGFAIDQGEPIADIAFEHGAGTFQTNVVYIFSNTGAFITTAVYCIFLHNKNKTWREYRLSKSPQLNLNYILAAITGFLWYSQFFFYGLGHVRMGQYKFTSWAIHMIMLVLFSMVAGLALKEWTHARKKTIFVLALAILVLLFAVFSLTVGNSNAT
ncbi:L-rhamnose/proton symporter RhaT [Zunongwangia endophytica]|uniref:L-rhamnose/proton symporter RhaT n=1 Tax=Zunongwangia endophytica TaxID=1808945 RepID=A0ABV8H6U7_9FLAO|nr:L-rhamnose/proton symporter RhaT [Zunongwangia endophytica]MDN3594848.1 L-rhamnose/proton symporter RhaT [Zunongwangia endophytica]